ncbi:unnamed protein product [Gordionus sp. m RMFG-2023]
MKIKPECCHSHTDHDSNLSLLVSADNQFSIDVLKTLLLSDIKGEEKNIIISPFNASQVLSMLLLGSKAKTFTQLAHTLHYDKILKDTSQLTPKNQETLHETIKEMSNALTKLSSKHVTLDIGNGLYPDNLFPLDSHYVKIIKELYKAKIQNLNFMEDPMNAERIINEDVAHATNGRITNLLPSNSLDESTRLVLTSAIYFKGDWKDKFDPSLTQKIPFTSDDGQTQEIPMMQGVKKAPYGVINISEPDSIPYEVEVLRLAYVDENLAMLFILPPQNCLDQFIKDLTPEKLNRLVKELRLEQQIRVTIPVFRVSYEAALKETLQALGSVDVFGENADLSGITNVSGVEQKLYLNQVYHRAFIEVNEEGSEAAAATGAVVGVRSIQIPLQFLANRPFLYILINMDNGSILFIGTYIIPGKIAFSEHDRVEYEVKVLRLDYVDERLTMYFVLPPQNGLSQFIKDLTPERLNRLVTDLRLEKEIWVAIPVFKIEYETKLKDTIQALGSVVIFGNNADLFGITSASKGDMEQKLYLSQVYHKAFIEVNEEGSEAAAATGALIALRAMLIPKEFTASRPFLYFIMDMVNGCILFIGTFVIPRSD